MPKGYFKKYTDEEKDFILSNYLKIPTKHIADRTNSSAQRVLRFLKSKGLEIPKDIVKGFLMDYKLKKGHGKGRKQVDYMSKQGIENSKKTRFKKGHKKSKEYDDGSVTYRCKDSERGLYFKYVRVSKDNWRLQHHVVWEKENGKIPDGHVITFIDKDPINTNINNLKLMSRAENMLHNSWLDYPKEIIPTLVLLNQLKHKINDL